MVAALEDRIGKVGTTVAQGLLVLTFLRVALLLLATVFGGCRNFLQTRGQAVEKNAGEQLPAPPPPPLPRDTVKVRRVTADAKVD